MAVVIRCLFESHNRRQGRRWSHFSGSFTASLSRSFKGRTMKRIVTALVAVAATCSVSLGQDRTQLVSEHLKGIGPMIGTWRYEGPLLEEVPGIAKKGSPYLLEVSWMLILDNNVIEEKWSATYEGGKKQSGKALIGWNTAEKQLTRGGMDSGGGMSLGVVAFADDAKSSTLTGKGIDGNGKAISFKNTIRITGKDSLTLQALERAGTIVEGPGPIYTLKRVSEPADSDKAVSLVYENLKDLEDFIGTWVAEDTLTEDVPGFAKQGEKVTYRPTMSWLQNKSVMQMDFVTAFANGKTTHDLWTFGWDAVNKKIVYSGFDSLGGRIWGTGKKESPDRWALETHWSDAKGRQGSLTDVTQILDNNATHIHEYTNGIVDGKPQPDGKVVYKRVK